MVEKQLVCLLQFNFKVYLWNKKIKKLIGEKLWYFKSINNIKHISELSRLNILIIETNTLNNVTFT